MTRRRWIGEPLCLCGQPADIKVLVSIYPLGVRPRSLVSSGSFGLCDSCVALNGENVAYALSSALAQDVEKLRQKNLRPTPVPRGRSAI